ncbi:MAG: chondroitinase family polysaccharide lyase [Paludibacter sp.]
MKSIKYTLSIISIILLSSTLSAQQKEFTHPSILSFENGIVPAIGDNHSQLTVSTEHYKHQNSSLQWNWNAPLAQWSIKQPIDYQIKKAGSKDASVSTFVFWVYNNHPIKDAKIKVEFLKDGRVCSFFEYGVDFTGWRGAWVAFDRDMQGKPEVGMNVMRITAPNITSGQLFFDHIMLSSLQDVRQHTADIQAPFINKNTQNHWLILLESWKKDFDLSVSEKLTAIEQTGIKEIQNRLKTLILSGQKSSNIQKITDEFKKYNIKNNSDGTLQGLPIFFERFGETYEHLGAENYKSLYSNLMGLSQCNQLMLNMAVTYNKSTNPAEKSSIAEMYVLLMRHFLDQGFQAGSAMGTLHHLGYSMRNFYTAAFLMEQPLRDAKLDQQVQQSMEWFAGTGEVKTKPQAPGMDIDAFNTSLIGRLASILMLNESPEKARYLHAFSRWIDNGLLYSDGTQGSFKVDGSIFHHRANYPAYAVGGLDGAVNAAWLLNKTDFRLQQTGRENLKKALLTMRTYSNLLTWPLSLSGRHPDGKGHVIPEQFAQLALAGSPDGKQLIDKELAAAYLRLVENKPTKFSKIFQQAGIVPELSPVGNWSYNYSCLGVHRRDNWSVTAMGHSRYLWATETYVGANLYGRYLNHGNLQILANGTPISNFGSGFNQEGWDWNHFPGTTAAVLPMKELRADVKNIDADSGYEEELLSDESFAGSISLQNKQGAFGMKLHEHDKYNGSLHARKSVFFFDNRVVALGSNIRSALPGKSVNTTLFQIYLPKTENAIEVNGKSITEFPYSNTLKIGKNILSDGNNNYFFVQQGNVTVSKSMQQSLDQETDAPTQNNFALAAINHGVTPRNASYEYMALVQPTADLVQTTSKQFANKNQCPYIILQQDSLAHIVRDKATQTTGYVLFEAGILKAITDISSVSIPCLIMTSTAIKNKMALSVCDPDLHFYEGKSDEKFDVNGKRIERSIYSRSWVNNPSAASEIEVVLNGKWKLEGTSEYFQIVNTTNGKTTLKVKCQHGFSRETMLIQ